MMNDRDEKMIDEYEELLVLLRQLHEDTPILEKQHRSIKKAFVSAQEKLESTIASAGDVITKSKETILADFKVECQKIIDDLFAEAQAQAADTLKKLKTEKENVEQLLSRIENVGMHLETTAERLGHQAEETKKQTTKRKKIELVDGDIYKGEELIKKFSAHIGIDLFVKRIIVRSGNPWKNDYCMLITGADATTIYGVIYKDGSVLEEQKGYPLSDSFMIYRGPSEQEILDSRR
jgi:hypothetical protein